MAEKTVHLLCVNDFHAELMESEATPGCAKLSGAIREFCRTHPNTAVVFGGDNYRGDPISEQTGGRAVTALIRALNVQASALGNHELDYPPSQLVRWQQEGGFSFLAANLCGSPAGDVPAFVKPYLMIEAAGVRIALLGLSTVEPLDAGNHPAPIRDLVLTDPAAAATRWISFLRRGGDLAGRPHVILALTHCGLKLGMDGAPEGAELSALCRKAAGIDGVFAAHWHQFLSVRLHGVPVAQGGCRGQGFAVMTLTLTKDNRLLSAEPSFVDLRPRLSVLPADPALQRVVDDCYTAAMETLGQRVGTALRDLPHRDAVTNEVPPAGTPLTALAVQVLAEETGIPIALFYSGWIISGLKAGPITLYNLLMALRFNQIPVAMTLPGSALLRALETGLRTLRGEGASPLAVGGLLLTADYGRPFGARLIDARFPDGSAIDPGRCYRVVMDDGLTENAMGFDFSAGTERFYYEKTIRGCIIEEIRRRGTLFPQPPHNVTLL